MPDPNETTNTEQAEAPARPARPLAPLAAGIAVAIVVVGVIGMGTWCSIHAERRNDQYQLILLGQSLYHGGTFYLDVWENKPPGIAWINRSALLLSGGGLIGPWTMPGVFAVLGIAVLGWTMKRLLSPVAAAVTVLLAAAVYSLRIYDTPSINPDFYSSILELAAGSLFFTAAYSLAPEIRVPLSAFAGILWAAATCIKPTGMAGLVAMLPAALALGRIRRLDEDRWFVAAGVTWVSFAGAAVVVAVILLIQGIFGSALSAVFVFNRETFGFGKALGAIRSWERAWDGLSVVALPLWLGLVGVAATCRVRGAKLLSFALVATLLLWWVLQVWLALMGPSMSMRYWQATFPPMLWLAGIGVYHLEAALRQLGTARRTFVIVLATLVLVLGRTGFDQMVHGVSGAFLASDKDPTEREHLAAVGQEVQKLAPEGETIYVWAYDASVYVYADRRPASRFTYPRTAEQLEQILEDLSAKPPAVLLVPDDNSPEFERWCESACHTALNTVLGGYEMRGPVGRYRTWVRRGPAEASAAANSGSG